MHGRECAQYLAGDTPAKATHNALLGLGPDMYLELIAPDPGQPPPVRARWFGLDALTDSRLVAWAAKSADLDRRAAAARRAGLPLGEVRTGRRELGGGRVLSWRLTYPDVHLGSGLVPFLIDWADSPHPAQAAPGGVHLLDLRGEHPEPAAIREDVRRLGLELHVLAGLEARTDGNTGHATWSCRAAIGASEARLLPVKILTRRPSPPIWA